MPAKGVTVQETDVAIVGAGPYGLSIAAHLHGRGVAMRIFGRPMSTWRDHMPSGTFLKSLGCASSLYNPGESFPMADFCEERGIPYTDDTTPVSVETFIAYGMEFQRRFVPNLEETDVTLIERVKDGFVLYTSAGEVVRARRVVLAVGITHFGYKPPVLAGLPEELVSHSYEHAEVARFAGKRVAVVGAGASAADLAGLLQEAGAAVHFIVRRESIHFQPPPSAKARSFAERLLRPRSGLGYGWKGFLCSRYPHVFYALPEKLRLFAVHRVNGPAPAWFAREKVVGRVAMHLGAKMEEATAEGQEVRLKFIEANGSQTDLRVDHVVAATGYKVEVERLRFLEPTLLRGIRSVEGRPVLSPHFESSVPGLYLVGLASSSSFGPLCRFAYGARFTSNHLAKHLARTAMEEPAQSRRMRPTPDSGGRFRAAAWLLKRVQKVPHRSH